MKKSPMAASLALALAFSSVTGMAAKDPQVGGAAMYPTKNILENVARSKDHTTLVAAIKAAGLADTLESAGPFTLFAPTDEAFAKLPADTVETLLKPENKDLLKKILAYHVVPGKISAKRLAKAIKKGHGKTTFPTLEGNTLTATRVGGSLLLTDEKGGLATISIADVYQANGVIHVVDSVLLPK